MRRCRALVCDGILAAELSQGRPVVHRLRAQTSDACVADLTTSEPHQPATPGTNCSLALKRTFSPQSVFVSVFWGVVGFVLSSHWQNTLTCWLFHHKKRIRWNLTGVKPTELLDFTPVIAKLETLWNLKSRIVQNLTHKHNNLCLTGSEMAVLHTQASKSSNKALSFSNNQQCNYKEENKDLNIPVYVCIYVTSFSSLIKQCQNLSCCQSKWNK